MAVASVTKQIGKTVKEPSNQGYKFKATWHVIEADLATYTFDPYADTTLVVGEASILTPNGMTIKPSGSFGYDITYNCVETTAQIM